MLLFYLLSHALLRCLQKLLQVLLLKLQLRELCVVPLLKSSPLCFISLLQLLLLLAVLLCSSCILRKGVQARLFKLS